MIGLGGRGRSRLAFADESPLRDADPRTKLVMSLWVSLAIMLPLNKLAVFMLVYAGLLLYGGLLSAALKQIWRLKWVLIGLFLIDWWVVSLELAVSVVLRLILMAGAFAFFFTTTTTAELRRALEWMRVPGRYAFSVSLAFQSLGYMEDQWKMILEAQRSRGAWSQDENERKWLQRVRDMIALTVPSIVLTTKRAWTATEAAYARGFDSPHYKPYQELRFSLKDAVLIIVMVVISIALYAWSGRLG